MNEHIELKANPIEYICEPCNYKTLRSYDLERHNKSKLHERNGQPKTRKCDECNYSAINHWLIKMHKIVNHSTLEERGKQKYYCAICDVVFFNPQYKEKHLQSAKHAKMSHNASLNETKK